MKNKTTNIRRSEIVLFIISILIFCSIIMGEDVANPAFIQNVVAATASPSAGPTAIPNITPTASPNVGMVTNNAQEDLWFYYQQLNGTEKTIYEGLLKAVSEGKQKCSLKNIEKKGHNKTIKKVISAFVNDHPEYYWLNGGGSTQYSDTSGNTIDTFKIELTAYAFGDNKKSTTKKMQKIQEKVDSIIADANTYTNVYDKITYVHDYLIQNIEYDHDRLKETEKATYSPKNDYIYTVYGALVEGKCVCAGYAKAFQLIMTNMGIPCGYITGKAGEPLDGHSWNIVELDGEYYYVDVTWDDMDMKEYPKETSHKYFFITTKQLTTTHTIDKSVFNIPKCTSKKYNYYKQKGYLLDVYDFKSIDKIFKLQRGEGIIDVQFSKKKEYNEAVEELFKKDKVFQLKAIKGKSMSYMTNDDFLLISLLL